MRSWDCQIAVLQEGKDSEMRNETNDFEGNAYKQLKRPREERTTSYCLCNEVQSIHVL